MRFLIALAFAAPLFSQTCTYVFTPPSFKIGAATFFGSVTVTAAPGSSCGDFFATVPAATPWLRIISNGGTVGSKVDFSVDENLGAAPRSTVINIGTQAVTIIQDGANCTFALNPTTKNMPVTGGQDTFTVQATCSWRAASNVNWISVGSNGTSGVPVPYTVAPNACVAGRNGIIALQQTNLTSPPTLAVTQDGSPANMTFSPSTLPVTAAAANYRIQVNTGDSCNWTATADVSWIQLTISTGTGTNGISFRLLENTTTTQRTGNIRVSGIAYSITQPGANAPATVINSVTNAADYGKDAVSPGEIVAIFGANLGPASIVTLQVANGAVTNSLAGTQVLFDGVPAPMIYTLKGQVSAVVPYGVAGKTSTDVQVKYQDQTSNTMTMPVRASTPAIFSIDSSGVGPGAILNQDTTTNTTGNPAARLSIIALYCTGGGVTDPASGDGEVIGGPLRRLTQTVTVTIGGINADVKYAGAAPGAVAGLTQINVEVPAALAPALALPVIVKIGNYTSTGSVTVAVK